MLPHYTGKGKKVPDDVMETATGALRALCADGAGVSSVKERHEKMVKLAKALISSK
jgi:hypothetical protein